jgi:hypothetical protein
VHLFSLGILWVAVVCVKRIGMVRTMILLPVRCGGAALRFAGRQVNRSATRNLTTARHVRLAAPSRRNAGKPIRQAMKISGAAMQHAEPRRRHVAALEFESMARKWLVFGIGIWLDWYAG